MSELQDLEQQGKLSYAEIESKNKLLKKSGYDFRIVFIEIDYPYFAHFYQLESIADCQISRSRSKNLIKLNRSNKLTDLKRDRKFLLNFKDLKLKLTRKNFATGIRRIGNGVAYAALYIGQYFTPFEINPKDLLTKQVTEIQKINPHRHFTFGTISKEESGSTVVQSRGSGSSGGNNSGSSIIPGAAGFSGSNTPTSRPGNRGADSGNKGSGSGIFINPEPGNNSPSGGSPNPGGSGSSCSSNESSSTQQSPPPIASTYPHLYQPECDSEACDSEGEFSEDEWSEEEFLKELNVVAKNSGELVVIKKDQFRDKAHHIDVFPGVKIPKSFDLEHVKTLSYEERLKYVRDRANLPEKTVFEMQLEASKFFRASTTHSFEGSLGRNKIPGTVYINEKTNTVAFVNKSDSNCRTFIKVSDKQLQRLRKRNYQLFPGV